MSSTSTYVNAKQARLPTFYLRNLFYFFNSLPARYSFETVQNAVNFILLSDMVDWGAGMSNVSSFIDVPDLRALLWMFSFFAKQIDGKPEKKSI